MQSTFTRVVRCLRKGTSVEEQLTEIHMRFAYMRVELRGLAEKRLQDHLLQDRFVFKLCQARSGIYNQPHQLKLFECVCCPDQNS